MDSEIIEKYIKGTATKTERESVLKWANSSPENRKKLDRLRADWVFSNLPSSAAPAQAVKEMRRRLRGGKSNIPIIIKVAAVLFLPLVVFSLYQSFRVNEMKNEITAVSDNYSGKNKDSLLYNVHSGVKGLVDLPDGSKVWLNSSSSVKCPAKFNIRQRVVELEGEGYFIVKGDPDWPMLVKTNRNITIKVTGTEFNLASYRNDSELKLTLIKGNVTILNGNDKTEMAVRPMEEIVIPDKITEQKSTQLADVHINTGWKDGYLMFDNTPMDQVIKKMERWYGVTFIVSDNSILNNNFTAEFKSESLSQVLDYIKKSSFIGYKIEETKVILFKQ
ncbi:MAG: FecR domain-containing protein [Bacteroidales bacterium]